MSSMAEGRKQQPSEKKTRRVREAFLASSLNPVFVTATKQL